MIIGNNGYLLHSLDILAARIRTHSAFETALHWYAKRGVDYFQNKPMALKAFSEDAHFLIFIALFSLRNSRRRGGGIAGATLSNLQAFAALQGLAGPNRVAAMIKLLKYAGFVEQAEVSNDQRSKILDLTSLGVELQHYLTITLLVSVQKFENDSNFLDLYQRDRDFMCRFFNEWLKLYAIGAHKFRAESQIGWFVHRIGGRELLFRIWVALSGRSLDASNIIALPYGQIAKNLGVSRSHIRLMIEHGMEVGFFKLWVAGGQAVEITDLFLAQYRDFTARQMANLHLAARLAANQVGPGEFIDWKYLGRMPEMQMPPQPVRTRQMAC